MKNLSTLLMLLFWSSFISLLAQEKKPVKFGEMSSKDFDLPASPVIDSNANAVILFDIGATNFVGNRKGDWISYVFIKHSRIKIINKNAFDLATVGIYLYGKGERQDEIDNIRASTFNMENGKLVETKLNLPDVFEDKLGESVLEKKFTMPNVKEGSVIEYTYRITSYHYDRIPSWSFQHLEFPCLYSEFEIATPDLVKYAIVHHGVDSFYLNKTEEGRGRIVFNDAVFLSTVLDKHKWVMKNIPAFKNEIFINSPQDYLDKIDFDLNQTFNGAYVRSLTTWENTTQVLLEYEAFFVPINIERSANLLKTLEKISPSEDTTMEAANHIYDYIRDNFTCIEDNDIFIRKDLYDVNKLHKGSVAELNLLLIALLRQKGLKAYPVILSTREFGTHPVQYPVLDKMNYVICMLKINNDTIYLDATRPQLGFGKLPLDCYNGHAQIIDDKEGGAIFLYPDDIREQKMTNVLIVNDEKGNGRMKGSLQYNPGYFESCGIRERINKNGENDFFKKIQAAYGADLQIENTSVDSLKKLDEAISVNYDLSFKLGNTDDIIYFDPIIGEIYKKNLFISAERKYPVEMDYPVDEMYVFAMEIPAGYEVDELPKSARVAFNENEGFYEYLIQKDETRVQLRCHIKLNRAIYGADEYNSIRNFFGFVVKKQNEQIVFKKKK